MLDLFKLFTRKSNLTPLSLYDMTIHEITVYLGEIDDKVRHELDDQLQIIRLGVASAMSGKKISLLDDNGGQKVKRVGRETIEEEMLALGEF